MVLTCPIRYKAYGQDFSAPDKKIILDRKLAPIDYDTNGQSYFVPLRYVTEYFGGSVLWDTEKGAKITFKGKVYSPSYYLKDSISMVNVWDIKTLLNLSSYRDDELNIISIAKEDAYLTQKEIKAILPTFNGYSAEDLEWMSKIIHAEAKGEPYEAKLAVGNVILNRKESATYPETVKGVIFDNKSGVQFSPTANGSIYNTPGNDSYLAALEVLEGKRNAEDALFFINPRYAKSTWVSRNREFAFTLKNHDFYY